MDIAEDASAIIMRAMARTPPALRGRMLRELMAHSSAALVIFEGRNPGIEAVYRLADAMVAKTPKP